MRSKKKKLLIKGLIRGTVFSGDALGTTLGNTIRVLMYIQYIMQRGNIPQKNFRVFVAGDDVLIIISK